jgi:hypothetical protein
LHDWKNRYGADTNRTAAADHIYLFVILGLQDSLGTAQWPLDLTENLI